MSKACAHLEKDDGAVSPVIGVILMVAITVVLAAVVFVLVSNLSKESTKAPEVSFATDENTDRIMVVKGAGGRDWAEFRIKGVEPASADVRYEVNANAVAGSTALSGSYATFSGAAFNAGDFVDFCGGASVTGDTSIQIIHAESNTIVVEATLVGIQACA